MTSTCARAALAADPTPPPAKRAWWTEAELEVLRQHYLTEGLRGCVPRLPGRSKSSILMLASRLGLRRQKPHAQPAESTEWIDAAIQRFYSQPVAQGGLKAFAQRLGRSRQWVYSRACRIGAITESRRRAWTAEEEAILEQMEGRGLVAIQRALRAAGFSRTQPAISCRLSLRGLIGAEDDPDIFSANQVAALMGVSDHAVGRWVDKGWLKASRDNSGTIIHGHRDRTAWRITRKDLRSFMRERIGDWDHKRVPQWWLVEILAGLPPSGGGR